MKKSELKKLVSEYRDLQLKLAKRNPSNRAPIEDEICKIKHRYFHETGNDLECDLKLSAGDKP